MALESKSAKEEIWIACARDFEFWIDCFCWTHNSKEYPDHPDRQTILWPYQVDMTRRLQAAIGQRDMLIEKSRDMGATWMCLLVMLHRWLFLRGQTFLLASRKEDLVDKKGSTDSLFWKLDYALSHLPAWMVPSSYRVENHLENEERGNTFDGETTNKHLAAGGRRTAVMLDEMGRIDNAQAILDATRDVTRCRLLPSTYCGAYGGFYKYANKLKAENPSHVLRVHWTLHPEKSKGLALDENGKPTSPWYREQCARGNPREIAENLDINPQEAGYQYFDQPLIDRLLKAARPPVLTGDFQYGPDLEGEFHQHARGRLQLWVPLDTNGQPPPGNYGVSCDVAMGIGGELSSQSVATVTERNTGRKVAQFASSSIEPREFARFCVALCRWFHGAKLIWEDNGPGKAFSKAIFDSTTYRNVYYRRDEKKVTHDVKQMAGWWSDKDSKFQLLSEYREALQLGKFINPCEEAIQECGQYIVVGPNQVVHSSSRDDDDPTAEGENHGDMVIADALGVKLLTFRDVEGQNESQAETPVNCFGYRFEEWRKEQRQKKYVFPLR